jgi:hypothetical protein
MRALTLQRAGAPPANPVELRATDAINTTADIRSLGDQPANWGLRDDGGHTYLACDRFAESLLPHGISLLNDLMATTAIERLAHVDPQKLLAPPPDWPSANPLNDMFSWEIRSRVRRLGGL